MQISTWNEATIKYKPKRYQLTLDDVESGVKLDFRAHDVIMIAL